MPSAEGVGPLSREAVRQSFHRQALACRRMGSPFTARLCMILAEDLDPDTATGSRALDWPGDPVADALPLRLCGALHALARSGRAPDLTAVYPPRQVPDAEFRSALSAAIAQHDGEVAGWLASPPQTNEVSRSGVLLGGLQIAAAETGRALSLLEIGASAGLNLLLDEWSYELGQGRRWGAANAPVAIDCDWRGAAPPLGRIWITGRAGSDRAPVDVRDAQAGERLLAYVWADQVGRIERTQAALRHAARRGPRIERAEAGDWLEARLAEPPAEGTCRVLMHSIFWQYLTEKEQHRIAMAMVASGIETATPEHPLAWLRMERDGDATSAAVLLTTWPGGRTRELGRADFHGRYVDWSGER